MADYRYHFCDALTGLRLEELPLNCQSYSQQISAAGTLTGTLALGNIDPAVNWRGATALKRTLIIAQRDDRYPWGGWITKRRPTNGGTVAEIGAQTLEGWLAEQEIQADLTYTNIDVFTIVRAILAQVAAQAGGNMRIEAGSNLAGQAATVTYLGKDSTKALDAINRLTEVAPGFEYTIDWTRSGNVFTPVMTLAAPGLSTMLDAVTLEYPGSLADYSFEEQVTANALTGVGADNAGTPLIARVEDTAGELAAGYPRVCGQVQMKDETDLTRLTARTTTAMQAGLTDYVVPAVELSPPQRPVDLQFGDFPLGAPVRLRITSLYHPAGTNGRPGLDATRRITGWSVVPTAAEKTTLTLGSTTGKILKPVTQRDQNARIADLDRRVRELATRT